MLHLLFVPELVFPRCSAGARHAEPASPNHLTDGMHAASTTSRSVLVLAGKYIDIWHGVPSCRKSINPRRDLDGGLIEDLSEMAGAFLSKNLAPRYGMPVEVCT